MTDIRMEKLSIEEKPAILWGEAAKKVFLYIHGKSGCKEEAELLAQIACRKGWQVLSFDLPEHGERKNERNAFNPWMAVPEIKAVYQYAERNWSRISIYANSLGAWFSMLALAEKSLEKCLFVSPVLDMRKLIETMMEWAGVSPERLEKEGEIATDFGETLSWKYFIYAKEHPIETWNYPTEILYGGKDNLTEQQIVVDFAAKFYCRLTVMEAGEHWFHTKEQLDVLRRWVEGKV